MQELVRALEKRREKNFWARFQIRPLSLSHFARTPLKVLLYAQISIALL